MREHTERQSPPWAVLMVDIDHFKQFNDRFGHEGGDNLLKAFADFITTELQIRRSGGTLGQGGVCPAVVGHRLAESNPSSGTYSPRHRRTATTRIEPIKPCQYRGCRVPTWRELRRLDAPRRSGAVQGEGKRAQSGRDCVRLWPSRDAYSRQPRANLQRSVLLGPRSSPFKVLIRVRPQPHDFAVFAFRQAGKRLRMPAST